MKMGRDIEIKLKLEGEIKRRQVVAHYRRLESDQLLKLVKIKRQV